MARALDSKSGCWGFESLLACTLYMIKKAIDFLGEVRVEIKKVT